MKQIEELQKKNRRYEGQITALEMERRTLDKQKARHSGCGRGVGSSYVVRCENTVTCAITCGTLFLRQISHSRVFWFL